MTSNNEFEGERFFSLHKVFWWTVYTLMLVGFLSCWVFINVKFLGNDFVIGGSIPQKQSSR